MSRFPNGMRALFNGDILHYHCAIVKGGGGLGRHTLRLEPGKAEPAAPNWPDCGPHTLGRQRATRMCIERWLEGTTQLRWFWDKLFNTHTYEWRRKLPASSRAWDGVRRMLPWGCATHILMAPLNSSKKGHGKACHVSLSCVVFTASCVEIRIFTPSYLLPE